jgi:hypothetical protein
LITYGIYRRPKWRSGRAEPPRAIWRGRFSLVQLRQTYPIKTLLFGGRVARPAHSLPPSTPVLCTCHKHRRLRFKVQGLRGGAYGQQSPSTETAWGSASVVLIANPMQPPPAPARTPSFPAVRVAGTHLSPPVQLSATNSPPTLLAASLLLLLYYPHMVCTKEASREASQPFEK